MNLKENRRASKTRFCFRSRFAVALRTILALHLVQLLGADESLNRLRTKAEAGDPTAQTALGQAFYLGEFGAATNYVEAVKWYRRAAEQNHAQAQYNLGWIYSEGKGVAPNYVEVAMWWRKAAEQNDAPAQNGLGLCYDHGLGVVQDHAEAVKWFRQAAEQGLSPAQYNLADHYSVGKGVAKDEGEAVKWYRKAAEQNNAPAQYNMGVCYNDGLGVAKDYAEAMEWWRKAAGQNHVMAQHNLGVSYNEGKSVTKDYVEAVKWYRKAAEQNFAPAQNDLGVCYANGFGVTKDYLEAYKWCLLAAAQGDELAKNVTPKLEGLLTRVQIAEGQKRAGEFKPSEVPSLVAQQGGSGGNPLAQPRAKAEAGDAKAQNELGEAFHAGGRGVPKNTVEAVKWFRQAAEQNFPAAQASLALCYERGDGVAKYEVEAYKWNLLAAAQGDTKAKRNVTLQELLLSPEEIAEGKRRAEAWLAHRKKSSTDNR